MILNLTREEKAFIAACIQIKAEAEEKENKKMKSKKPRKR